MPARTLRGGSLPARGVYDWDGKDVAAYLEGCSWAPPGLAGRARAHGLDGFGLCGLTKEVLRAEYGVRELGVVKDVLRQVHWLREGAMGEPPPARPGGHRPRPLTAPAAHRTAAVQAPVSGGGGDAALPATRSPPQFAALSALHDALRSPDPDPDPDDPEEPAQAWDGEHRTRAGVLAPIRNPPRVPASDADEDTLRAADAAPPADVSTAAEAPQAPMQPGGRAFGILEKERRRTDIARLFAMWDTCSDVSREGSGYIEQAELEDVLARWHGWTGKKERADGAGEVLLGFDLNADGRLDAAEFERFMWGQTAAKPIAAFDHFMRFLMQTVSAAADVSEAARREEGLTALFRKWDVDGSGAVDAEELCEVIVRYNECSRLEGNAAAAVVMDGWDDGSGALDSGEFLALFVAKAERMAPEVFDYLLYRLGRCVDDLLYERARRVGFQPLAVSDLEAVWRQSTSSTPLVLYGEAVDPAMHVERLAAERRTTVRSLLVTNTKHEAIALDALSKWGLGRGHWIYIVVDRAYGRLDAFLRAVGTALRRGPTYLFHRHFRLWVMVNTPGYYALPQILRHGAIPVPLDSVRADRAVRYEAEQRIDPPALAAGTAKLLF